jgi:hypothetical protein
MKYYNIKTKTGETYLIDSNQHTAIKRVLMQNFRDRKEFYDLDTDTTIKIDSIVSISLDRD